MVADNVKNPGAEDFTVKDNVLIGKKQPRQTDYTCMGKMLFDSFKKKPDMIGQVDSATGKEETMAVMGERALRCALWMKKQGIKSNDVVAVCTHNHLSSFAPCSATLYLGAILSTWDPKLNIAAARHLMTLVQPKMIFVNEAAASTVIEASKLERHEVTVVVFGEHPGTISFTEILKNHSKSEMESFQCAEITDMSQTAVILFSSGTTGPPKGVQLPQGALLLHMEIKEGFALKGTVPLWFSTLSWISGLYLMLQCIVSLTTRILADNFDEEETFKLIEKYKISWMMVSTSMANRLARHDVRGKYDVSSLKTIFVGGAVLTRESQNALKKQFPTTVALQAYGMTEAGGLVTVQAENSSSGSCGRVFTNVELKIVDTNTGEALGPNKIGEIWMNLPTKTTGYYKNPVSTAETIDKDGWVHSGDLAYYNDKYEIFFVERMKELIKYRSCHVSPCEIEDLLVSHPAVLEAAVVAMPHPTDDEHPIAFVSTLPGTTVTEKELVELVENNVMDHSRLRGGVKFLESLPHNASGKVARKELREMAKAFAVS